MTISTTNGINLYDGNGSTTVFPYVFPITDETHLQVIHTDVAGVETTKTLTTHYTVSGVGSASGNVTYIGTAIPSTEKLTIKRVVPLKQLVDLENQGNVSAEVNESKYDELTMMAIQQQEELDRCPKVDISSGETGATYITNINAAVAAAELAQAGAETAETAAELAETNCDADLVLTNADVVSAEAAKVAAELAETNAETAETNAETAETNAETAQAAAELAETNVAADLVLTNADVVSAVAAKDAAEIAETAAELAETNAAADLVLTNADVVLAEAAKDAAEIAETNAAIDAAALATHLTATEDMSNKTFIDALTFQENTTPSTPASGDRKIFPKADGKFYQVDDNGFESELGGGGVGGINYFIDGSFDAESSIGDWLTYLDAAGENPVDGTGGTAVVTFAQNATTPLRGTNDFKLVKDAANRQGNGASCAFTCDLADKGKKLTISFDYDTSHASYADDDIRFSVYDVTNAVLIRINGEDLKGGKGTHYAQFQTASDSVSYRLIAHVSSTNAAAYDLYFDNFSVGPTNISKGSIITDWKAYTPNLVGFTASTTNLEWKRLGDTMIIRGYITTNSAVTTTLEMSLPDGYTAKASVASSEYYGKVSASINSKFWDGFVAPSIASGGTTYGRGGFVFNAASGETSAAWQSTTPATWASGNVINLLNIVIPIEGWSSDAAMSSDLGGREIVMEASMGSSQSGVSGLTKVQFNTVAKDTSGSFDPTTNYRFTVPETGSYLVDYAAYMLGIADTEQVNLYVYKNGAEEQRVFEYASGAHYVLSASNILNLVKGDYLEIYTIGGGTYDIGSSYSRFSVNKLASPQTVLETETVAASYSRGAALSCPNGVDTVVPYTQKVGSDNEADTHNAYDTGTGLYTIPVSGWYVINAQLLMVITTTWGAGNTASLSVQKNGTSARNLDFQTALVGGVNFYMRTRGTTTMLLDKGDTIAISMDQGSGAALNTLASAAYNQFSIHRIK